MWYFCHNSQEINSRIFKVANQNDTDYRSQTLYWNNLLVNLGKTNTYLGVFQRFKKPLFLKQGIIRHVIIKPLSDGFLHDSNVNCE